MNDLFVSLNYWFNDWIGFAHFYGVFVVTSFHLPGPSIPCHWVMRGSGVWPPLCDVTSPTPPNPGRPPEVREPPFLVTHWLVETPQANKPRLLDPQGSCVALCSGLELDLPPLGSFSELSSSPRPFLQCSSLCVVRVSRYVLYQKPLGDERDHGRPGDRSPSLGLAVASHSL